MSKFLISELLSLCNFEDRSQEETERQQRCARSKAWNLVKNIYKLKEKDKAAHDSPTDKWIMPAASRNGKRIDCNLSNYVPFVVPGLSASSSSTTPSPTSPSSSSQDSVFDVSRYTEYPAPERSGSTSGELRSGRPAA